MSDKFDPRRKGSIAVNPNFRIGMDGHESADVYDETRDFIEEVGNVTDVPITYKDATYLFSYIIEEYSDEILADMESASREELQAHVDAIEERRNEPDKDELLNDLTDEVVERDDVDRDDVAAAIESFREEVEGDDE